MRSYLAGIEAVRRRLRSGVIEPVWSRRRRRAAFKALLELDDHLLKDIGIRRTDAWAAANGLLSLNDIANEPLGIATEPRCMRLDAVRG
jgi:uncharacterized protein YjiS (DUF1127 family)